jgi:pyruvate dehydrogenase E2 component (dihydrolipoamide acetyltransferase)
MAEITMPKLSDTMTEGTLVQWKKKKGDTVSMGEVIAEVETDKATMEMEAFEDGVLTEIYVQEGTKVSVGERIAMIGEEGAAAAPSASNKPADKGKDTQAVPESEKPAAAPESKATPDAGQEEAAPKAEGSGERVKASPLARKVAAATGVDLGGLSGSGPGGRIIERDVLAASGGKEAPPRAAKPAPAAAAPASQPARAAAPAPAPAPPAKLAPAVAGLKDQRIPLSGMRKAIAERLLASKTQIPHFYLHIEVDAGPLMKLRSEVNVAGEKDGNKFSINDFVLKATAGAISRNPKVNASFAGDAVVEFSSVHLAVAVAIDDGLVTPVVRDAQNKSLKEISLAVKDLAARARGKKLKPEEYQGGTFTVSNLGSYGIDRFDAIINPPQAAILSVGNIIKKPVVDASGAIVVGQRMDIGLSCDHRVVDGAIGAQFLASLRQLIEQPLLLLI